MPRAFAALICAALWIGTPVAAQSLDTSPTTERFAVPSIRDAVTLGRGSIFTNDALADGRDRWRSGSYAVSILRGPEGLTSLPDRPFVLREIRLRSEIIAPARLTAPSPNDRRYAGVLALGLHTHFARGASEYSLGFDAVGVGPMTLVGDIQRVAHEFVGLPNPAAALANQIGNALYPTISGEAGRPYALGGLGNVRPFVEAQVGVETYARIGFDVTFGGFGTGGITLRDAVTGHRYRGAQFGPPTGLSFVFGGDVAYVTGSAYLPAGGAVTLTPVRSRLRAGVQWQGDRTDVFYGITRLSQEFDQQPIAQTVGSINVRIRF